MKCRDGGSDRGWMTELTVLTDRVTARCDLLLVQLLPDSGSSTAGDECQTQRRNSAGFTLMVTMLKGIVVEIERHQRC